MAWQKPHNIVKHFSSKKKKKKLSSNAGDAGSIPVVEELRSHMLWGKKVCAETIEPCATWKVLGAGTETQCSKINKFFFFLKKPRPGCQVCSLLMKSCFQDLSVDISLDILINR